MNSRHFNFPLFSNLLETNILNIRPSQKMVETTLFFSFHLQLIRQIEFSVTVDLGRGAFFQRPLESMKLKFQTCIVFRNNVTQILGEMFMENN